MPLLSLDDYEIAAAERLPAMVYDYYRGGANDEVTLRDNRQAFSRVAIRYRVLTDVSRRSTATQVQGQGVRAPILIAPMALQAMAHPDGELASARAAAAAGTVMIVSTLATRSIEEVRGAAPDASLWFQLYVFPDREATRELVRRAEAAGYGALVLTVDTPFLGQRERDVRNRFTLPQGLSLANLEPVGEQQLPALAHGSGLAAHADRMLDPTLSWKDVEWLRSITRLPVLLKGIVRGDDALRALEHGASGIIVSNHGGRQLDGAIASLDALRYVSSAVRGRTELFLDGGIRRGTDVLKALALGARAVLIGRPILWGLAVDGEAGVARVLELLGNEFDLAMALTGCRNVNEIDAGLVSDR